MVNCVVGHNSTLHIYLYKYNSIYREDKHLQGVLNKPLCKCLSFIIDLLVQYHTKTFRQINILYFYRLFKQRSNLFYRKACNSTTYLSN